MLDIIPLTSARKHTQFYISTNHQKTWDTGIIIILLEVYDPEDLLKNFRTHNMHSKPFDHGTIYQSQFS